MTYAQTAYTAESYERERQRNQEMADRYKALENWQGVFRSRLEMWGRHGPSPALRASIAEAAKEIGDVVDQIMNATPPMLSGPVKNRY